MKGAGFRGWRGRGYPGREPRPRGRRRCQSGRANSKAAQGSIGPGDADIGRVSQSVAGKQREALLERVEVRGEARHPHALRSASAPCRHGGRRWWWPFSRVRGNRPVSFPSAPLVTKRATIKESQASPSCSLAPTPPQLLLGPLGPPLGRPLYLIGFTPPRSPSPPPPPGTAACKAW